MIDAFSRDVYTLPIRCEADETVVLAVLQQQKASNGAEGQGLGVRQCRVSQAAKRPEHLYECVWKSRRFNMRLKSKIYQRFKLNKIYIYLSY